jgi:DNA repair protein RadC
MSLIAPHDRPREKLIEKGAEVLTNAELLAIIIGSGSREESVIQLSQRVLQASENQFSEMSRLTAEDFQQFKGIGQVKSVTLCALFEISRRRTKEKGTKVSISGSNDVFLEMSSDLMDLNHEEFWVIYLNRAHGIIKKERISKGGISGTVVDSKLIMKKALLLLASSMVLVHNHPSGNRNPSEQDKNVTEKIKSACKLLEINLIDHIIIAGNSYYSFADELIL